ncbi:MAG: hypothetical protein RSB88_05210 [Akkermansia sp.]
MRWIDMSCVLECTEVTSKCIRVMLNGISSELRSKYDHKLDAKNRIAVPSEWRPSEGCCLLLLKSSRKLLPMIKALTHEKFQEYIETIHSMSYNPAQKDMLIGKLHSDCVETTVNAQGKMLIPKKMCELSKLGTDVKLVGRGGYFEIWKPELYDEVELLEAAELEELNAELGIF